jgi:Membrane-associated phospholipid phosphatase
MTTLEHLNEAIFLMLNHIAGHNSLLDSLLVFCANDLLFLLVIPILFLWGLPTQWRRHSYQPEENALLYKSRKTFIWMAIACVIAVIISSIIASFVFEKRPFVTQHVDLLFKHPADDSFPSDHATVSFAICGMFLFWLLSSIRLVLHLPQENNTPAKRFHLLWKPLTLFFLVLIACCLIGVARVISGVHYPGDILAGMIVGILAAGITTAFSRPLDIVMQWVLRLAQYLHLA